jgi:hypothetical protein
MLRDADDDITANTDFPVPHRKKIWFTDPLERLHTQISILAPARATHHRTTRPNQRRPEPTFGGHCSGRSGGPSRSQV